MSYTRKQYRDAADELSSTCTIPDNDLIAAALNLLADARVEHAIEGYHPDTGTWSAVFGDMGWRYTLERCQREIVELRREIPQDRYRIGYRFITGSEEVPASYYRSF